MIPMQRRGGYNFYRTGFEYEPIVGDGGVSFYCRGLSVSVLDFWWIQYSVVYLPPNLKS
jgi:hypothetical protein